MTATKKILFVCVENSNRSQMAQAFAIIHGSGKANAYSAGSHPLGKINPKAITAMKELGYDLSAHSSKSFNEIPELEYEHLITMGCGDKCPYTLFFALVNDDFIQPWKSGEDFGGAWGSQQNNFCGWKR